MANTHFSGPVSVGPGQVESLITTKSLDKEDNGKTFFLNLAGGFTVTLPALATVDAGWKVKIVVGITPTTAYIITENAASDTNTIVGCMTASTGQTNAAAFSATGVTFITFVVSSGAVKGDWVEITTDGTNWYATGCSTVPAGITMT